jgi:hypothetical protein
MHPLSDSMDARIAQLERHVRALRRYAIALTGTLVVGVAAAFRSQEPAILRAKGLVILDDAGRERILIGAPIPHARNRVRTDTLRVAKEWAIRFPDSARYMGFYRRYRHSMHGMLVLDERGFDRVAVGDSNPDPNIGRRIGPATGIEINDERGFERTGYGMLRVGTSNRVVLGLDSDDGTEGATLSLVDGGKVGLSIYGRQERLMFFGIMPPDPSIGVQDTVNGLLLVRGKNVAHALGTDTRRR